MKNEADNTSTEVAPVFEVLIRVCLFMHEGDSEMLKNPKPGHESMTCRCVHVPKIQVVANSVVRRGNISGSFPDGESEASLQLTITIFRMNFEAMVCVCFICIQFGVKSRKIRF